MTDLAERYGAPNPLRRPAIVVVVVLLAGAGLGWLLWAMLLHARPQVQSQLLSYDVHGQHRVDARFTVVRRERDVAASCLLRAYAADHTVVGERNVPVAASSPARVILQTAVRTERLATTVDLVGCTTADQRRPG